MCTDVKDCMTTCVRVLVLLYAFDSALGCDPWEFKCDNSECVRGSRRCNGVVDCGDGSDEKRCPTTPPAMTDRFCVDGQFCCANGRSIYMAWRCDGDTDCLDGSDEDNCPTIAPRPIPTATITISITSSVGIIIILLCCLYFFYHRRKHPHPPQACHSLPVTPSVFTPPQYSDSLQQSAIINVSFTYTNIGRPPPLYTSHVDISDMSAPYDGIIEPPPQYEPHSTRVLATECGQQHMAGRQTQDTPPISGDKQCVGERRDNRDTDVDHRDRTN